MTKTAKTRPGIAVPGRAMEPDANHHESPDSTLKCTTTAAERQPFRVSDLLLCGAGNAVPRRQLMALTGCKDRELRLLIESERRQGVPILSDNRNGYFLPGDEAERERCVRSLRSRAAEIEKTAAAIERAEV